MNWCFSQTNIKKVWKKLGKWMTNDNFQRMNYTDSIWVEKWRKKLPYMLKIYTEIEVDESETISLLRSVRHMHIKGNAIIKWAKMKKRKCYRFACAMCNVHCAPCRKCGFCVKNWRRKEDLCNSLHRSIKSTTAWFAMHGCIDCFRVVGIDHRELCAVNGQIQNPNQNQTTDTQMVIK